MFEFVRFCHAHLASDAAMNAFLKLAARHIETEFVDSVPEGQLEDNVTQLLLLRAVVKPDPVHGFRVTNEHTSFLLGIMNITSQYDVQQHEAGAKRACEEFVRLRLLHEQMGHSGFIPSQAVMKYLATRPLSPQQHSTAVHMALKLGSPYCMNLEFYRMVRSAKHRRTDHNNENYFTSNTIDRFLPNEVRSPDSSLWADDVFDNDDIFSWVYPPYLYFDKVYDSKHGRCHHPLLSHEVTLLRDDVVAIDMLNRAASLAITYFGFKLSVPRAANWGRNLPRAAFQLRRVLDFLQITIPTLATNVTRALVRASARCAACSSLMLLCVRDAIDRTIEVDDDEAAEEGMGRAKVTTSSCDPRDDDEELESVSVSDDGGP